MPSMQLYADLPARRWRQVIADFLVIAWVILWIQVGQRIHARAVTQGQSGEKLESGGREFSGSMTDAGSRLRRVPMVGDELQSPFDRAAKTGTSISEAGRDIQLGADQLGTLLGVLTAALPIALVLALWGQARLRYARQVRLSRAMEGYGGADADVVRRLAGLDAESLGLVPRPHKFVAGEPVPQELVGATVAPSTPAQAAHPTQPAQPTGPDAGVAAAPEPVPTQTSVGDAVRNDD